MEINRLRKEFYLAFNHLLLKELHNVSGEAFKVFRLELRIFLQRTDDNKVSFVTKLLTLTDKDIRRVGSGPSVEKEVQLERCYICSVYVEQVSGTPFLQVFLIIVFVEKVSA